MLRVFVPRMTSAFMLFQVLVYVLLLTGSTLSTSAVPIQPELRVTKGGNKLRSQALLESRGEVGTGPPLQMIEPAYVRFHDRAAAPPNPTGVYTPLATIESAQASAIGGSAQVQRRYVLPAAPSANYQPMATISV